MNASWINYFTLHILSGYVKSGSKGGDSYTASVVTAPSVCPETGGRMKVCYRNPLFSSLLCFLPSSVPLFTPSVLPSILPSLTSFLPSIHPSFLPSFYVRQIGGPFWGGPLHDQTVVDRYCVFLDCSVLHCTVLFRTIPYRPNNLLFLAALCFPIQIISHLLTLPLSPSLRIIERVEAAVENPLEQLAPITTSSRIIGAYEDI